jgi:hypothetical protein
MAQQLPDAFGPLALVNIVQRLEPFPVFLFDLPGVVFEIL